MMTRIPSYKLRPCGYGNICNGINLYLKGRIWRLLSEDKTNASTFSWFAWLRLKERITCWPQR